MSSETGTTLDSDVTVLVPELDQLGIHRPGQDFVPNNVIASDLGKNYVLLSTLKRIGQSHVDAFCELQDNDARPRSSSGCGTGITYNTLLKMSRRCA
ncbi:hypothetical protein ACET3Z_000680 [Daucus carota]